MGDVKQSGIVFSLPQLDSICSSWEINNRTGAVRVKAPKTGLEHGAYPDYDKYATKTAKSISRVLRRKLPRSDTQRKAGGKIKKKNRRATDVKGSNSKKKAREASEGDSDSELDAGSELDVGSESANSDDQSVVDFSESEPEPEQPKRRNKRKSSSRGGLMDESVRRKAKRLGHRILDNTDSEDSSNDIITESDYRKFRNNLGDKNDRGKRSRRTNKASARVQPLDSETDFDTESESDSQSRAKNSRNRNRRRTVKSATRKRPSKRLQLPSSDDESESELPSAKYRRRKRGNADQPRGRTTIIQPSEPEPKKSKGAIESAEKSGSDESRETPDLEHFWR